MKESSIMLPEEIAMIVKKNLIHKYGTESQFIFYISNNRARTRCSSKQLLMNKVEKFRKFLDQSGASMVMLGEPYYEAAEQKVPVEIQGSSELIKALL